MNLQDILVQAHNQDLIRESLKRRSPIFPKWIEEKHDGIIYFSTILRKEHEGEWYREHHMSTFQETEAVDANQGRQYFISRVYMSILFGEVQPELQTLDGRSLWDVDDDQRSEAKRLTGYEKEN